MSVTPLAARFSRVDDEDLGARIVERRTTLGLTVSALAKLAGVDRGVVSRIEDGGNARLDRIRAIEMALDAEERRQGDDVRSVVARPEVTPVGDPEQGLVTFDVKGPASGFSVVLKGPVENIDRLEEAVLRLIAGMERTRTDETGE